MPFSGKIYSSYAKIIPQSSRQVLQTQVDQLGGETVGLLLRMMKIYFSTGRYIILDSGIYVLKGLIHLSKKGVSACAVINKRRYWPSMVPGIEIGDNFGRMEVGGDRCHKL